MPLSVPMMNLPMLVRATTGAGCPRRPAVPAVAGWSARPLRAFAATAAPARCAAAKAVGA